MKPFLYPVIFGSCALFALSCSPGNKQDTTSASTDSTSAIVQNTPEAPPVKNDSSFATFISLFQQPETNFPEWAVESFLKTENIGHLTPKQVLQTRPFYVVLYVHFMPVGPGMDELHAASFSQDGTLITDLKVGSSYPSSGPDGGGKDYYTPSYDTEQNVLTIINSSIEWDESRQEDVTNEACNYFLLEEDGTLTNGRKYPQISTQYLEESSLESYSKEELKIMRNEIFASCGYIFKTEPMKSYYGKMRWYKPLLDNVDDKLNDFEKANVKLIKEAEDQK
ncbi:MAG: YARHG domain-containing protein [Bacteroidota bacterium]